MKKFSIAGIGVILSLICAASLMAQNISLEEAINTSYKGIETDLKQGLNVAILSFASPSNRISDFVIEELMDSFTRGKKLSIVERGKLDIVREEMKLQLSGDVSDESAQSIGKMLGAQIIIGGGLTDLGNVYRFRLYAVNVETAKREASYTFNVNRQDEQIVFLLRPEKETPKAQAASTTPEKKESAAEGALYRIGGRGPAGGVVFYDKGSFSAGWRYLEAAPNETERNLQWGASRRDAKGTATVIGSGKQNTQTVITALAERQETRKAAQLCTELDFDGYKDWFLPSKEELNLLYLNLKSKGSGNFTNSIYWSSSQDDTDRAWGQDFKNGTQAYYPKTRELTVRAIRAF